MRKFVGTIAAMALFSGLFATAPASAAAPDGELLVSYIVPTEHGDLFLEVVHPTDGGDIIPAPTILTYSPYDAALHSRNADKDSYVPDGYARATADLIGTGNSGGCWDYGGIREKETAYDLVEWIAKQKWSTGKIGMIGGSYEGTTANAAAVMRPPHLTTIVPQAAISRWYGYAFSGGVRYSLNSEAIGHQGPGAVADEGIDTPLAFDFGLAIPPPTDPQNADWAARVQSTITPCDEVAHTEHGYDDTPDYDDFWLERDYLKDAAKVEIPVLVASNWGDWNVKQEESWNWYNALKNSDKRVLYMGTRWEGHGAPVHGTAEKNKYQTTVHKWFDHYLMGHDNGIDKLPTIVSQTSDQAGPGKWNSGAPKVRNLTLYLQNVPVTDASSYQWMMGPDKPRDYSGFGAAPTPAAFPSTNINTETHALHHGRANHDWHWFESPMLRKDVRIFGAPKLQIRSTIGREWITITPTLADGDHEDMIILAGQHAGSNDKNSLVGVTRGFLDTRYRKGLDKQVPVEPGKPFDSTVTLKPTDYTFLEGHFIGLNVQTEILEWALAKPYPGCDVTPDPSNPTGATKGESCATFTINWKKAETRLILPVVDAPKNPRSLFMFGHIHEPDCGLPVCP
jgi:X-Pro dipeptidyl-peptidase